MGGGLKIKGEALLFFNKYFPLKLISYFRGEFSTLTHLFGDMDVVCSYIFEGLKITPPPSGFQPGGAGEIKKNSENKNKIVRRGAHFFSENKTQIWLLKK